MAIILTAEEINKCDNDIAIIDLFLNARFTSIIENGIEDEPDVIDGWKLMMENLIYLRYMAADMSSLSFLISFENEERSNEIKDAAMIYNNAAEKVSHAIPIYLEEYHHKVPKKKSKIINLKKKEVIKDEGAQRNKIRRRLF